MRGTAKNALYRDCVGEELCGLHNYLEQRPRSKMGEKWGYGSKSYVTTIMKTEKEKNPTLDG